MQRFRALIAAMLLALLSACATTYQPVQPGYTGPTAVIADSYFVRTHSKSEFFYVEQVDGHAVDNGRIRSLRESQGQGFYLHPDDMERAVPARPLTLVIVARTQYAAPILSMTHDVFQVKGTLQFTPQSGKRYVVRGTLGENDSEVWLEDEATSQVVGQKFKAEGDAAKMGFFDK